MSSTVSHRYPPACVYALSQRNVGPEAQFFDLAGSDTLPVQNFWTRRIGKWNRGDRGFSNSVNNLRMLRGNSLGFEAQFQRDRQKYAMRATHQTSRISRWKTASLRSLGLILRSKTVRSIPADFGTCFATWVLAHERA